MQQGDDLVSMLERFKTMTPAQRAVLSQLFAGGGGGSECVLQTKTGSSEFSNVSVGLIVLPACA
jgi:hypothetical protein